MEYVEGLPIAAPAADWTMRRKLEVFLDVMAAVEIAHRNFIVHRDLKPATTTRQNIGPMKPCASGESSMTRTTTSANRPRSCCNRGFAILISYVSVT